MSFYDEDADRDREVDQQTGQLYLCRGVFGVVWGYVYLKLDIGFGDQGWDEIEVG